MNSTMAMANESRCSTRGCQPPGLAAAAAWKTVGMRRAMAASERETTEVRAPLSLNNCSLCLIPPKSVDRPRTQRMFPMIEPVIDALTTPVQSFGQSDPGDDQLRGYRTSRSTIHRRLRPCGPPVPPSPSRIQLATGMIAMAEQMKSAVGFAIAGTQRSAIAAGTKTSSQFSDGFSMVVAIDSILADSSGKSKRRIYHPAEEIYAAKRKIVTPSMRTFRLKRSEAQTPSTKLQGRSKQRSSKRTRARAFEIRGEFYAPDQNHRSFCRSIRYFDRSFFLLTFAASQSRSATLCARGRSYLGNHRGAFDREHEITGGRPGCFERFAIEPGCAHPTTLARAPIERMSEPRNSPAVISLPMPNGSLQRFYVEDSPVLDAELAAQYPEIKSYRGVGIDDETATVRFDWTPLGLHALVLSADRPAVNVQPQPDKGQMVYTSYYDRRVAFECGVPESKVARFGPEAPASPNSAVGNNAVWTERPAVAARGSSVTRLGATRWPVLLLPSTPTSMPRMSSTKRNWRFT